MQSHKCSQCHERLDANQTVVLLTAYGVSLHRSCFSSMSAGQILRAMGSDETIVFTLDDQGRTPEIQHRVRYADEITSNGHPIDEPVKWLD